MAESEWVVDRRTNSRGAGGGTVPTVAVPMSEPSPTFTAKAAGQWVLRERQANGASRQATEPAMTITGSADNGNFEWFRDRPATTTDVVAAPGYPVTGSRQNAEGSVKITVQDALILQSFRRDFPLAGSRTKQFEQVGNAVPPVLAAAVCGVLL